MLKLRRGIVSSIEPLRVRIDGDERAAWADTALVGEVREGDDVVVNVEAQDLGLGSGGFDIVHVNLTRGLDGEGAGDEHVMKLNYTSLQHPVAPVERDGGERRLVPVLVIPLHGHLAPAVWAAAQARPGLRVGFLQGAGGALAGTLSRDVVELRSRDLLCGHVTAGAAFGGEDEAVSLLGALDAVGALGMPTLVSPRLSSSDPRPRHRGLSHHTASVLELLLGTVRVPVPEAEVQGWPLLEAGAPEGGSPQAALDSLIELCGGHHDIAVQRVDLDGYAASGLPSTTMGRTIAEDPLFFASALAAGRALAEAGEAI